MLDLRYVPEPKLLFSHGQRLDDPIAGLTLFGPLGKKPAAITLGIAGTPDCIALFKIWLQAAQGYIAGDGSAKWPFYAGFSAIYGTSLEASPILEQAINSDTLHSTARIADAKTRVFKTVSLFADAIIEAINREENRPSVWIVVIPEYVHRYCRPQSIVPSDERIIANRLIRKASKKLSGPEQLSLLDSPRQVEDDEPWEDTPDLSEFDVHFRNQLKARLLPHRTTTQVIRDSTLNPNLYLNNFGKPIRRTEPPSAVAWNLSNGIFYKAGGRPWKLSDIRKEVCYLGLVFKKMAESSKERRAVCCGAQMFLDSGEGFVFRGADGRWYSDESKSYHLNERAAASLLDIALNEYKRIRGGSPKEVFIHGRSAFNAFEWKGFKSAASAKTSLTGVRIKKSGALKLFTDHRSTVLRGTWFKENATRGWLWTHGHIPKLESYPGFRVPSPLLIDVVKGDAPIDTVVSDIQALTKLNYNACRYSDALPITIKFANAVGEVLTAAPISATEQPQPFMYYI